jgi:hypothetical protein
VLPDPVPRDGGRALARWGLLGEGAVPVFTPGARYPLAGLLLALPIRVSAGPVLRSGGPALAIALSSHRRGQPSRTDVVPRSVSEN